LKVYAVLGDPIEHSLSPVMHNATFQAMGLQASYHAFRVKIPRLRDAILGADAMGFGGLNLTIPLKESGKFHVADALGVRYARDLERKVPRRRRSWSQIRARSHERGGGE